MILTCALLGALVAAPASVAGQQPERLDRTGWSATANTARCDTCADKAIDGNTGSNWIEGTDRPPYPHHITIDMGATQDVAGLAYLPRQGWSGGYIGQYEIRVYDDADAVPQEPTTAATLEYPGTVDEQILSVPVTSGRYVRLSHLNRASGRDRTTAVAELNVIAAPAASSPSPAPPGAAIDEPVCLDSQSFVCDIPTPPKVTDRSYNPADVDWQGLIQTVKNICSFEPRFCTFAIRTFFHDSGSFLGGSADAADASIILNDMETMLEDNTQAGMAPYARAILAHMGDFYGCSAADLLTVVAAYAPTGLGSEVDPSFDNRFTAPLYVGRIDHSREASTSVLRDMYSKLPQEFDATPRFLAFWDKTLSPHVAPPPTAASDEQASGTNYWGFTERDIIALMGAHTLMDNLGCQQQSCSGDKKMFLWDTDWYKDMNSGTCTPRKPPPLDDDNKAINKSGSKGKTPSADERRAMRECSFKSAAGLELADNLQCRIDSMRNRAEDADQQAGLSFQFVDWKPTNSRSECCSEDPTCAPCTATSTDWWCDGAEEGTVHWPYTWADCELSFAIAEEREGDYCFRRRDIRYAHEVDCTEMGDDSELVISLKVMSHTEFFQPMLKFENDNLKWTHYYNKGFNKLSALGATWGDNPVRMFELVIEQRALIPGDPMPLPEGLCPPLAEIFSAAAGAPADSAADLRVTAVSD